MLESKAMSCQFERVTIHFVDIENIMLSACSKRTDIIFIADEWAPGKYSTLLRHFVTLLQTYNPGGLVGLLTQTNTQNIVTGSYNALHIPLMNTESFLHESAEHTDTICCGSVSDQMLEALAILKARESRDRFDPSVVLISSVNAYHREQLSDISEAYDRSAVHQPRLQVRARLAVTSRRV